MLHSTIPNIKVLKQFATQRLLLLVYVTPELNSKDLELVYVRSFEMNQRQTYRESRKLVNITIIIIIYKRISYLPNLRGWTYDTMYQVT